VGVKHVKRSAAVLRKLHLELQLCLGHGLVAYGARLTDTRPAPETVGYSEWKCSFVDLLFGLRSEYGFFFHLAHPPGKAHG